MKVPGVILIRNKREQENIQVPPGAAQVLTQKKMTKKTGKIAQLKAPLIKTKKMRRKLMEARKTRMDEKIAKV